MKKLLLAVLFGTAVPLLPFSFAQPAAAPAVDAAHEARIAWFREAKFGLFIHWGVYSIPAGVWQGQPVPGLGEWIMHNAPIPVKEYQELPKQFNPVKFNAEAWVQMAVDTGMKYIVITSKHHDGFAMYHSTRPAPIIFTTPRPFTATRSRSWRRPVPGTASASAFAYSQTQDWHEPNGMGNTNDFGLADKAKDFAALRPRHRPSRR